MLLQSSPQAWPTSSCESLANRDLLQLAAPEKVTMKVPRE